VKDLTHDDLVEIAAKWLQRNRCSVVITELVSAGEIPDAFGYCHSGITTLVECKATRADFLGDHKKTFRRYADQGLGRYRYYLAPKGVIDPTELPEGWGLITVNENGRTRQVVHAAFHEMRERAQRREIGLLVSAMRRMSSDAKGINVKFYLIDGVMTKTTLGVQPD